MLWLLLHVAADRPIAAAVSDLLYGRLQHVLRLRLLAVYVHFLRYFDTVMAAQRFQILLIHQLS